VTFGSASRAVRAHRPPAGWRSGGAAVAWRCPLV